jgi:uncharacterized protein with FMN-binding domain
MRKVLKWIGIILLGLIVVSAVYGLFGLKETRALQISAVDLSSIPDGTYKGSYESYRWTNSLTVTVENYRITAITPIITQSGREKLVAELSHKIIDAQSSKVDAVSGATASSNAFFKSVEDALSRAGK